MGDMNCSDKTLWADTAETTEAVSIRTAKALREPLQFQLGIYATASILN
ncbi:hypothetical protein SAMN05216288_0258 [Pseudomonas punonensis]|uniref:Uncharacterized protein n=1 Tax=Phytopseudomonas punonensis TaxID=1220495 RepID=A0A1M7NB25_9GAMM|nr:hypothetical protein SAMN05216288_0258 [Pseudomonas punonensis]